MAVGRGTVHLDTNFLVRGLEAGSDQECVISAWLDAHRPLRVSAAAWAEFMCGAAASEPPPASAMQAFSAMVGVPVPLGATEAVVAARCYNASGRRRGTMVDCMIAATAIVADAALATATVSDFERLVPLGLRLAR